MNDHYNGPGPSREELRHFCCRAHAHRWAETNRRQSSE